MAKKKASAKSKAKVKAPVKKVAKKAAKKVAKQAAKPVVKKTAKKGTPKVAKKTALKKTVAKKAAPKKVVAKKAVASKKAPAKVSAQKSAVSQHYQDALTQLSPLDDRILVRLSEAERRTAGGLYIPDTVADVSGNLAGQVMAIGRGHMSKKGYVQPMDVKIGDKVVFADYSGTKIKIKNEDLVILRESELLGVVSK